MRTVFVVKTFCDYEIAGPYKNYAHVSVSVGQIKSLKLESLDYKG